MPDADRQGATRTSALKIRPNTIASEAISAVPPPLFRPGRAAVELDEFAASAGLEPAGDCDVLSSRLVFPSARLLQKRICVLCAVAILQLLSASCQSSNHG